MSSPSTTSWGTRAMDQGGKRRNQVDTAVMSVIRRQRGSSTASCAGLQSRQFSAHAGDAGADQGLVADEPEGKADQDRREDRQPWPLCRVSDGRSRPSQKSLCRHSADYRGPAAAARCIDSVMRSVSRIPSKTGGKVRLDDGKFGKFSVRLDFGTSLHSSQTCPRRSGLANNHEQTQSCLQSHLSGECRIISVCLGYQLFQAARLVHIRLAGTGGSGGPLALHRRWAMLRVLHAKGSDGFAYPEGTFL